MGHRACSTSAGIGLSRPLLIPVHEGDEQAGSYRSPGRGEGPEAVVRQGKKRGSKLRVPSKESAQGDLAARCGDKPAVVRKNARSASKGSTCSTHTRTSVCSTRVPADDHDLLGFTSDPGSEHVAMTADPRIVELIGKVTDLTREVAMLREQVKITPAPASASRRSSQNSHGSLLERKPTPVCDLNLDNVARMSSADEREPHSGGIQRKGTPYHMQSEDSNGQFFAESEDSC